MRRAWISLRFTPEPRRAVVLSGLRRVGYEPIDGLTDDPPDSSLLLSWNRIHRADEVARRFIERGLPVLILENATWGNSFAGNNWWTLCRNFHNVKDTFPIFGNDRWDSLGIELEPWRQDGERVILASRGIGAGRYRMPLNWPRQQHGRLRPHPGRGPAKPLREDLAKCSEVVTWGSGAAVLALSWGIKVQSCQPEWIAEQDNTTEGRLAMFRRLAWAQATHEEIASGEAFDRLLEFNHRKG